jgi:exopolysaccharide production protein ExoQ
MRIVSGGGDSLDGDPRSQAFLAVCYLSVVAIAVMHYRQILFVVRRNPAIFALLALACLSPFWAETPDLVARRAIAAAGTTLFGAVVAIRLTLAEQLKLFRWALRIAAGLSVALLVVAPHAAISTGADGSVLRGIFLHKNHLGATMALGALMEWCYSETTRAANLIRRLSLFLYLVLLVLSNSMTSVVAFAATLIVLYAFRLLHGRLSLPLPVVVMLILLGAVITMGIQSSVTELLGRSSDLTGRTELWSFTWSMIAKRPLFGYGLSGFWMGASEESVSLQTQLGWTPVYSHNGYLEILLSLGFVGMMLFLIALGTGIRRVLSRARRNASIQDMWPLAFFSFFLVHNMAECSILMQNSLEWSLCLTTVISADATLMGTLSSTAEEPEGSSLPVTEYA